MYRNSVFRKNLENYLKNKAKFYTRQGLELSHISEMNIIFITRSNFLTYKHYIERPMPMVER